MSFTQIPDLLIDCGQLNAYELAAALFIARKTVGWGKTTDGISLQQFMDALKLSKPTVIKTIQGLIDHQIVTKTESFRENGGQSYNRYAFTAGFIDAANQQRLGNATPVNDVDRGEGKGDLLPPVNVVDPQDKSNNKTNLKQKPSPHSPPPAEATQTAGQKGQGAGLVEAVALEFPASLTEAECASARKILCGLEDENAQLLLDTLAAKLHAGENIANRMGLLRWMVGKLGAGELDTSAGSCWRSGIQRVRLAESGVTRQQLHDLWNDIQTLQRFMQLEPEGSPQWQHFAGQLESRSAELTQVRDLLRLTEPDNSTK